VAADPTEVTYGQALRSGDTVLRFFKQIGVGETVIMLQLKLRHMGSAGISTPGSLSDGERVSRWPAGFAFAACSRLAGQGQDSHSHESIPFRRTRLFLRVTLRFRECGARRPPSASCGYRSDQTIRVEDRRRILSHHPRDWFLREFPAFAGAVERLDKATAHD
jgi:hypothetical protein